MEVKIVTSLNAIDLDENKPVFCDIETQGLYIRPRLIQMYQPEHSNICYILDLAPIGYSKIAYTINLDGAKELLLRLHTVWYNASYDLGTLNIAPNKVDDLFYAVKTSHCQFQEFGLDKVVSKMGFDNYYAGLDKKALQKQGFVLGAYLSDAQIRYSATDVLVLSLIWKNELVQKVIANNMAYKVDMLSLKYAMEYQQNGLLVNQKSRLTMLHNSSDDVVRLTKELPDGFNPNSYVQVRKYLDTDKSDHDALVIYSLSDRPLAAKAKFIIDLKRAKKEVSYLESINFAKMYTKFNVAGAITGRFTSSGGDLDNGFNAQQIPRQFQPLFKHTTKDTVVIEMDYSTLELRLACTMFGDPTMYKQLMDGEDLHTSMAMSISGKKLHKDGLLGTEYDVLGIDKGEYLTKADRQTAKSVNFGFVFGMSAATFRNYAFTTYGVKLSEQECNDIRNKYFAKYKEFKKYHSKIWNEYKKPKFFYTTALGRRTKPRLGTDGINGPVQGSGVETTKLAVHYLIKENNDALKYIFNVVHDAIYMRVPIEDKDIWTERIKTAMLRGWEEISKTKIFKYKDIPMPIG